MEESFHQSKKLSKEQMVSLMRKDNTRAAVHFMIMYTVLLSMAALTVYSWHQQWWMFLIAQFLFAVMYCSTFACEHEMVHNTPFRTTVYNQIAARLVGIVQLYPSTAFRELHFTHHRYTHEPGKDPEISLGNKGLPPILQNIPMYLGWITGIPLLLFKILMMVAGAFGMPEVLRKNLFPFIRPEVRAKLMLESAYILGIYASLIFLAVYVNSGLWGIFAGQVIGQCLLSTYLVPEHNGLPHEGNIFSRTRSMRTSSFVRWLMWNMPYHAEHHAYPGIPYYALPEVHELLKDEIVHKNDGYPDFHLKVITREIR
jgi:fatty acid desaturase